MDNASTSRAPTSATATLDMNPWLPTGDVLISMSAVTTQTTATTQRKTVRTRREAFRAVVKTASKGRPPAVASISMNVKILPTTAATTEKTV